MPSRPEKGALIVFFAMVARMLSAAAARLLRRGESASNWAWETVALSRSSFVRSRFTWASSTLASAERSCASSTEVSWRTSTSPAFTMLPASKSISTILPSSSAATVTPWTAVSEPTEVSVSCQVSLLASAVDTDSKAWRLLRVDQGLDLHDLDQDDERNDREGGDDGENVFICGEVCG